MGRSPGGAAQVSPRGRSDQGHGDVGCCTTSKWITWNISRYNRTKVHQERRRRGNKVKQRNHPKGLGSEGWGAHTKCDSEQGKGQMWT